MSDETSSNLPEITDPVDYMDRLTFHPEISVPTEDLPSFDEGEELIPRSFKVPRRLDQTLAEIAARRGHGVTKSDVIREYLEAAAAAELAATGEGEVFIPLSEALRALTGLRRLPRTA
jgi:hypothetical protein